MACIRALFAAITLIAACDDGGSRAACCDASGQLEGADANLGHRDDATLSEPALPVADASLSPRELDASLRSPLEADEASKRDGGSSPPSRGERAPDMLDGGAETFEDAIGVAPDGSLSPQELDAANVADASELRGARELLTWVLDTLEQQRPPSHDELIDRFAPSFLAELPEPALRETFRGLSEQLAPLELIELYAPSALSLRGVLDTASGRWSVTIQASSTLPRQVLGLWFEMSPSAPPLSDEEAWQRLSNFADRGQLLVGAIAGDTCEPLRQYGEKGPLAIGSASKLWVLLALDERLQRDPSLSWDARIAVRDELKSLPSGDLQDAPAGTEVTLHELARKMIANSDNTATDHLIDLLGREAVESIQAATGHESSARNVPWLMTRELFALKLWAPSPQVDRYRDAPISEKRTMLEELRRLPLDFSAALSWRAPRMLDLEWFASPLDLCRALAVISARARFNPGAPLLALLRPSTEAFDRAQWPYVGYKGGSEPGVLNFSWLLQRADGQWYGVVLSLNDEQRPIDQAAVFEVVRGLATYLAADASIL